MPRYSRKRSYRKRSTKRAYKSYARKAPRRARYLPSRAGAIQRATFTPRGKKVQFVHDETYFMNGNGVKGTNTMGMRFDLTNPFNPAGLGIDETPFWGAFNANTSSVMSGQPYDAPVDGFSRWCGFAENAPYAQCLVMSAKYDIRFEQLHKDPDAVPDPLSGVQAFSVCTTVKKDLVNNLTVMESNITDWQKARGVKQNNMTPLIVDKVGPANSTANQSLQHGSYNARSFHSVQDLKDNYEALAGQFVGVGQFTPPNERAYLTVGVLDRLTDGAHDDAYVLPDLLVRVKITYDCELTQVNEVNNLDV